MLHTGLRAHEVCSLQVRQVKMVKRSGTLDIVGKRNKYREFPLNVTARDILKEYLATLPKGTIYLFSSGKTGQALSERGLNYIVKNSLIWQSFMISVRMICVIALAIAWRRSFPSIDWRKLWDMTRSTRLCSMSKRQRVIYSTYIH
jgi:integrase